MARSEPRGAAPRPAERPDGRGELWRCTPIPMHQRVLNNHRPTRLGCVRGKKCGEVIVPTALCVRDTGRQLAADGCTGATCSRPCFLFVRPGSPIAAKGKFSSQTAFKRRRRSRRAQVGLVSPRCGSDLRSHRPAVTCTSTAALEEALPRPQVEHAPRRFRQPPVCLQRHLEPQVRPQAQLRPVQSSSPTAAPWAALELPQPGTWRSDSFRAPLIRRQASPTLPTCRCRRSPPPLPPPPACRGPDSRTGGRGPPGSRCTAWRMKICSRRRRWRMPKSTRAMPGAR